MEGRPDEGRIYPGATMWPGMLPSTTANYLPAPRAPLLSAPGFPPFGATDPGNLFRPYLTSLPPAGLQMANADHLSHKQISPIKTENKPKVSEILKNEKNEKKMEPKAKESHSNGGLKTSTKDTSIETTENSRSDSTTSTASSHNSVVMTTSPGGGVYSMFPSSEPVMTCPKLGATDSLSMFYQSLYSSKPLTTNQQNRKVHATSTYMPEVGTLPSVTVTSPSVTAKTLLSNKKKNIEESSSANGDVKTEKHKKIKNCPGELYKMSDSAIKKNKDNVMNKSDTSGGLQSEEIKMPSSGHLLSLIKSSSVSSLSNSNMNIKTVESRTSYSESTNSSLTATSVPVTSLTKSITSSTIMDKNEIGESTKDSSKTNLTKGVKSNQKEGTGNIPVGIAVARKRQDTTAIATETTTAGSWSRHGNPSQDSRSTVSSQSSGLGSNLVLTGGQSIVGPSQTAASMWYGLPSVYPHPSTLDPTHMIPPPGVRLCHHPLTGQMVFVPSLEGQPMWPFLPPPAHSAYPQQLEAGCTGQESNHAQLLPSAAHHPYLPSIPLAAGQPFGFPTAMPYFYPPGVPYSGVSGAYATSQSVDTSVLSRGTSPFDESMMPSPVRSSSRPGQFILKSIKEEHYRSDSRSAERKSARSSHSPSKKEDAKVENAKSDRKCKSETKCDAKSLVRTESDNSADNEILDVTTVDEAEQNRTKSLISLTHVDGLELLSTLAEQKRQAELTTHSPGLQRESKDSSVSPQQTPEISKTSKIDELIKAGSEVLEVESKSNIISQRKFDDLVKVSEDRYWGQDEVQEVKPRKPDVNKNYKLVEKSITPRKYSFSVKKEENDLESPASPPLIAMEAMDSMEIEMRARLAELQRRYKEKQRELARLTRQSRDKHHHSEGSNSGKRGPGRPKKKKILTGKTRGRKPKSMSVQSAESSSSLDGAVFKPKFKANLHDQESSSSPEKEVPKSKSKPVKRAASCSSSDEVLSSMAAKISKKKMKSDIKKAKQAARENVLIAKKLKARKKLELSKNIKLKNAGVAKPVTVRKVGRPKSLSKSANENDNATQVKSENTPPHKKRKVGRPKKCESDKQQGTELIVSKKAKPQSNLFGMSKEKASLMQELTVDIDLSNNYSALDKAWQRRRSERIFLSEPSPQPSPSVSHQSEEASSTVSPSHKVNKQPIKKIVLPEVWRDKVNEESTVLDSVSSLAKMEDVDSSGDSDGDDLPLSTFVQRPQTPEPRSCIMSAEELKSGLRVLIPKEGLFYEGVIREIQPPDVYGVVIDGERGGRPHIYSREELLAEIILDVQPQSPRFIPEGSRISALWSEQFSCLYPGTVDKSSPKPGEDSRLISVEFDDGDTGKIPLGHIHMLPPDYPVIEYDPNPIFLIGRRRSTVSEFDNLCSVKERRLSVSAPVSPNQPCDKKVKRGPGRPPKRPKLDNLNSIGENDVFLDNDDSMSPGTLPTVKQFTNVTKSGRAVETSEEKAWEFKPRPAKFVYDDTVKTSGSTKSPSKENKWLFVEDAQKSTEYASTEKDEMKKIAKRVQKSACTGVTHTSRQPWRWQGSSTKRPGMKGKARKEFYKAIIKGRETIRVGDSAIFLTTGRPHLPYIGHIISMWEGWGGNMVVKVRWFYHPEETKGAARKLAGVKGALYQSPHEDENDVQTISHKCQVMPYDEYISRMEKGSDTSDTYYLAGYYDPVSGGVSQADTLMQI